MNCGHKIFTILLILSVALGACSKKDKVNYENSGVVGKWKSTDIQGSIIEKSTGDEKIQEFADNADGALFEINANGTYTVTTGGDWNSAKYHISGNQISFNNYFSSYAFKGTFTVNQNSWSIVQTPDELIRMYVAIVKKADPDTELTEKYMEDHYTISNITYTFRKQ